MKHTRKDTTLFSINLCCVRRNKCSLSCHSIYLNKELARLMLALYSRFTYCQCLQETSSHALHYAFKTCWLLYVPLALSTKKSIL